MNADPKRVESLADIAALPADTTDVFVVRLDDAKAAALLRLRGLRRLVSDGDSAITDVGVQSLGQLTVLEHLDLEWAAGISDHALRSLAEMKTLRYLDLGFCRGISSTAVQDLRRALPDTEIDAEGSGGGLAQRRIERLSPRDVELVRQCLEAAANGPFFPDWEFSTLCGVEKNDVRAILRAWPGASVDASLEELAIHNVLGNLLGYPIDAPSDWSKFISVPPREVEGLFERWRTTEDA